MSSPKWIIAILMAFVLLQVINGIIEYQWLGNTVGEEGTIEAIIQPTLSPNYLYGLWDALWWKYAQFAPILPDGSYNPWSLFRYAVLLPLSAGVAFVIILSMLRVVAQALGSVLGVFGR